MSASEVCLRCGRTGEPGHELKPCSHSECPVPKPMQVPEGMFVHITPKPDACEHDFKGGHDLTDDEGRVCGFTTVCTKCGLDAMTYSLRCGE